MVVGILAHVDAGKTTLSESILYHIGAIKNMGRVDHGNAFLDTDKLERARGITIFSKEATFNIDDRIITLMDTPGHVDFSAEMERTLQVLDYVILVINGADGVQSHTHTLWSLLEANHIPTFVFANKMDQQGTDREKLLINLKKHLFDGCIDFSNQNNKELIENIAVSNEKLLEFYMETGRIDDSQVRELILERKIVPCFFGSALKDIGVNELLQGIKRYTKEKEYPKEFGAKVFKISRDSQGNRLTHMKITGGNLKVKTLLKGKNSDDWGEKADQIRIYFGEKFKTVNEAEAGTICAVTGLSNTFAGQNIGIEETTDNIFLEPVLTYRINLPEGSDVHVLYKKLQQLQEEDPQLHIVWNDKLNEIYVNLMGQVQIEILKSIILERFDIEVEFDLGNIVYKESIAEPVVGMGHFEPLKHYAEVHVLMEPGEKGSGITISTNCSEDILDKSWQKSILSNLKEKEHIGVLIGAAITDIKITLIAGRAHQKHTEGGDFREAAYRAVRQGLKQAKSIVLEPYYKYRLELPTEMVGRAITDIQRMYGKFSPPQILDEMSIITGTAPVSTMLYYHNEVISYTKGRGRLYCTLDGYEPCHNQDEVIEKINYNSESDLDNPTSSIFCSHGAGFEVKWNEVEEFIHIEKHTIGNSKTNDESNLIQNIKEQKDIKVNEKELEEIFERTYGTVKREKNAFKKKIRYSNVDNNKEHNHIKKNNNIEEYLLIDGYNIIYAWDELRQLADINLDGARTKLIDILCNYQGYKKCKLIVVFDAYKVKGNPGSIEKHNNIHVVFTKEAETADRYIEKTVYDIGRKFNVTVATSDSLEQMIIMGRGAHRLSAQGLKEEVERVNKQIQESIIKKQSIKKNYLLDSINIDIEDILKS